MMKHGKICKKSLIIVYKINFIVDNNFSEVMGFIFHPSVTGEFFNKVKCYTDISGTPQFTFTIKGYLYKTLKEDYFMKLPLNLKKAILKGILLVINEKWNTVRLRIIFRHKYKIDIMDYILNILGKYNIEDELLKLYTSLLGRVGIAGISVQTLSTMFRYMKSLPKYQKNIIASIADMMAYHRFKNEITPNDFFDFYGQNSGIECQSLRKKIRLSNGYILFLWIRPTPIALVSSKLLSLLSAKYFIYNISESIELEFQKTLLSYKVNSFKHENELSVPYSFEPYTWYYVVITHKKSMFKDTFTIYINENLVLKQNIPFIRNKDKIKCVIGKGYNGLMGPIVMVSSDV